VRPNVSEQLAGVARILADTVAPALVDPYPADILGGLIATLDALAVSWADVPAYLAWDAGETMALLTDASPALDAEQRGRLATLAGAPARDPLDLRALEDHHRAVLELLADVIAAGPPPDATPRIAAHLRERATRFPVVAAQRMPGQR